MMEIIKHLFGLCGEGHPNLITISVLLVIVTTTIKLRKKHLNE
jgi:hypothetical protein